MVGGMALVRCLNTLGCPEFSLAEACALAAKHGLAGVEVRALGGTVDLGGYLAATYGSPEALADRLATEKTGGRVVACNTSRKLVGWGAAEREQLIDVVPWAEALGVRWLRVFDGGRTADAGELAQAVLQVQRGGDADDLFVSGLGPLAHRGGLVDLGERGGGVVEVVVEERQRVVNVV